MTHGRHDGPVAGAQREASQAPASADAGPAPLEAPRPRLFCVVAPERAEALVAPLRAHFAGEPQVAVLVERRASGADARPPGEARGRAAVAQRDPVRALPAALHPEARHLQLVQHMEPVGRSLEDATMAELVGRSLASEPGAVSELWWRVSPRMLARLGLRIGDRPAERSTSHLLGRMLDELPTHDPERAPLTHWLDAVVDRYGEEERHADASTSESPLPRLSRRSHSQPFAHPH